MVRVPDGMSRRNRVDPFGDVHAVAARGLMTGNRGCLVDDAGVIRRHHVGSLWILCELEFRGWHHPLAQPRTWTPLFFLDDAVGLAAGHRPCGLCRRDEYRTYRDAVAAATSEPPMAATDLDRRLARERITRGRGLERRSDRILWRSPIDDLPAGTVIVDASGSASVLTRGHLLRFTFGEWVDPSPRPRGVEVVVLTPPTSVAALIGGFVPRLHPTASDVAG